MVRPLAHRRPFLTAWWENLFIANFPVPDRLLLPRLPAGLELDRWEGRAFVSLVAFGFRDTRVFGVRWPGYRNFPEINLRTYVRHGIDRGVVFIREFVGLRFVAQIARWCYNEPYRVLPLTNEVAGTHDAIAVDYRLRCGGREHTIRVIGGRPASATPDDRVTHFFKELRWGFGRGRGGHTLRYEVEHPPWLTYPVRDFAIDLDWGELYGPEWAFLTKATPESVILAAGSPVAMYPHRRL
jgi:uncharacterized protein YqjF (DUF2071 family)